MKALPRRFKQWLALAPWERRLLASILLLLPTIGAALRLIGFNRSRALLERCAPPIPRTGATGGPPGARDTAQRIARLVAIAASRGAYRATCLRQSLALWWLLKRRGINTQLRIGVRKEGGALQAHAWVEHAGAPLGQGPLDHAPFPGWPSHMPP
jgi:hypothetical protein